MDDKTYYKVLKVETTVDDRSDIDMYALMPINENIINDLEEKLKYKRQVEESPLNPHITYLHNSVEYIDIEDANNKEKMLNLDGKIITSKDLENIDYGIDEATPSELSFHFVDDFYFSGHFEQIINPSFYFGNFILFSSESVSLDQLKNDFQKFAAKNSNDGDTIAPTA